MQCSATDEELAAVYNEYKQYASLLNDAFEEFGRKSRALVACGSVIAKERASLEPTEELRDTRLASEMLLVTLFEDNYIINGDESASQENIYEASCRVGSKLPTRILH